MVLCALVLSIMGTLDVSARVRSCRGDPIVWLSNGQRVQLTVSIAADANEVSAIVYTVHAPEGTKVERSVYNGDPNVRQKESVVFMDDHEAGRYTTETLVTLKDSSAKAVDVTALSMVTSEKQAAVGVSGGRSMEFSSSR